MTSFKLNNDLEVGKKGINPKVLIIAIVILGCLALWVEAKQEENRLSTMFYKWYNHEPNEYAVFIPQLVEQEQEDSFRANLARKVTITSDKKILDVIKSSNNKIIEFFQGYDIDMTEKIDNLKDIYIYPVTEESSDACGYVDGSSLEIYIREDIIAMEEKLESVYVHEVLHYLGALDSSVLNVTEGLTDVIAEKIVGDKYIIAGGYIYQRQVAQMLLIANPDLIKVIFNTSELGVNTRISEEINGKLKKFTVNTFEGAINKEPALVLEEALEVVAQSTEETDKFLNSNVQIQEIIIAYSNACNIPAEDVKKIKDLFVVPYKSYFIDLGNQEVLIFN